MHRAILVAALSFTLVLGLLTAYALIRYGPRPLELISLLVLALFGYGIIGALTQPPRD